jgi:hypothetical protein
VRWLAGRPPRLHAHSRQRFRKVGTRSAQAIAKIVVAGVWEKQPRLAIGGVAPIPLRLSATGEALGRGATVAEAQEILQREIAPIDDLRSTAEYRRQVAANLLRQFWDESRRGSHIRDHRFFDWQPGWRPALECHVVRSLENTCVSLRAADRRAASDVVAFLRCSRSGS